MSAPFPLALPGSSQGVRQLRCLPLVVVGCHADGATDDPANPHACPICIVNEDGHGRQCFECGQQYCGDCSGAAGVVDCPTCRAPFDVPAEVDIAWLIKLLKRPEGPLFTGRNFKGRRRAPTSGLLPPRGDVQTWHRVPAGPHRAGSVVPPRRRPGSHQRAVHPRGDVQGWHRGPAGLQRGCPAHQARR